MFLFIQEQYPNAQSVHDGSWLSNRKEYTRLFPVAYGQSAQADTPHLIARGPRGQFLRSDGRINEQTVALFRQRLSHLDDAAAYAQCFPYQALLVQAPIELFYAFHEIEAEWGTALGPGIQDSRTGYFLGTMG